MLLLILKILGLALLIAVVCILMVYMTWRMYGG